MPVVHEVGTVSGRDPLVAQVSTRRPRYLAQKSSLDLIPDWDGYYIGDVWSAQRSKNRQRMLNRQRNHVNSYAQRPFYQHVDNHG